METTSPTAITPRQAEYLTDLLAKVLDRDRIAGQLEPTADAEDLEYEVNRLTIKAAYRMGVSGKAAASALATPDLMAMIPTLSQQRATETIAWAQEQR
jgi:hypothetical protein